MTRKLITLVLVGVLAVGLLGPAAAKKKKKPKKSGPTPVELQYFLRTDSDCEALFLSLTDGADETDCIYGDGGFNDVYQQIGLDTVNHYAGTEGFPLTLDPSRPVTGFLPLRGWSQQGVGTGVGTARVDVTLFATVAGEEKEIGAFSGSYSAGPNHVEELEFEITLDAALAGSVAESIRLDVWSHGQTIGGRGVEHDHTTPAIIKIPGIR